MTNTSQSLFPIWQCNDDLRSILTWIFSGVSARLRHKVLEKISKHYFEFCGILRDYNAKYSHSLFTVFRQAADSDGSPSITQTAHSLFGGNRTRGRFKPTVFCYYLMVVAFNKMRPRRNGRHFTEDISQCILLNEKLCILIRFHQSLFLWP